MDLKRKLEKEGAFEFGSLSNNVILVGHSMGDFVARATVVYPNLIKSSVKIVLTLSTPHQYVLFFSFSCCPLLVLLFSLSFIDLQSSRRSSSKAVGDLPPSRRSSLSASPFSLSDQIMDKNLTTIVDCETSLKMKKPKFRAQQESYNLIQGDTSSEVYEEGPSTRRTSDDDLYMAVIRDIIAQDIITLRR
ncbi:unnamed protein product [Lactuca virosa]|uniref:GPI inositol-deacylase n=1 Tax=Lactuca virosa TaxID=75947 RepID=A0AAU9PHU5_9ASTR|nr:unnamed protein product [Lactuca virosa]